MDMTSTIDQITNAYAALSHYEDTGTVLAEREGRQSTASFRTHFERDRRFSFMVTVDAPPGHEHTHQLSRENGKLRYVDPDGREETPESLASAIASLAGVSLGCAHTIPRLLLPQEIGGRGVFDWTDRSLGADLVLDGLPCFQLEVGEGDYRQKIYVAQESLLIRRLTIEEIGGTRTLDYVILPRP